MRVLLPSIVDPATHSGGAWTVTRELIDLLEQGSLAADVEVIALPHYGGFGRRARQSTAIATSLVTSLPAKVAFARNRHFRSRVLASLADRRPDLVLVNGSDLLWLLDDIPPEVPTALIAHNIESQLLAAQIAATSWHARPFRRWAARECRRLRAFETLGLERIGRIVFLSSADEAYAHTRAASLRSMTLPPVFGSPPVPRSLTSRSVGGLTMGMLANFDWWPNAHGLRWFLREVFPSTPASSRLHLFGQASRSAAGSDPRVIAHGFVEDLQEVWATCDFMICPILTGSGVCVKVAEAVYNGMPIVTTRIGARGLPVKPSSALAVLDHTEEWIHFLCNEAAHFGMEIVHPAVAGLFSAERYSESLGAFLDTSTPALASIEARASSATLG